MFRKGLATAMPSCASDAPTSFRDDQAPVLIVAPVIDHRAGLDGLIGDHVERGVNLGLALEAGVAAGGKSPDNAGSRDFPGPRERRDLIPLVLLGHEHKRLVQGAPAGADEGHRPGARLFGSELPRGYAGAFLLILVFPY